MAIVLGIETSCDETGVAIYHSEKGLLADTLFSQIDLHNLYGGVVPELASRDHIRKITLLIDECITKANITKEEIDAIAYTEGPGLNGALLVGAGVANGLAFSLNKPVIPIHHLEGHLLSPFLNQENKPETPFVALLVSGGHSQLIAVNEIGSYTLLGDTLDDAAGEAFDKTAKMLGLPYPGGKHIAELAKLGTDKYQLPRPMLNTHDCNMSFSGLKTATLTLIKNISKEHTIDNIIKQDIAKAIEEAITDVLVKKAGLALQQTGISRLVVSGGVSANLTLRRKLDHTLSKIQILYPPLNLCTDNGAMIAITGYMRLKEAKYTYSFSVKPRWQLSDLQSPHNHAN